MAEERKKIKSTISDDGSHADFEIESHADFEIDSQAVSDADSQDVSEAESYIDFDDILDTLSNG